MRDQAPECDCSGSSHRRGTARTHVVGRGHALRNGTSHRHTRWCWGTGTCPPPAPEASAEAGPCRTGQSSFLRDYSGPLGIARAEEEQRQRPPMRARGLSLKNEAGSVAHEIVPHMLRKRPLRIVSTQVCIAKACLIISGILAMWVSLARRQ